MDARNDASGPALVTLLTDFGTADGYVAAMKGVLYSAAPELRVVDLSHEVAPQDVLHAGLVWRASLNYFPAGTVHVAVVDPGVGTKRRILAVQLDSGGVLLAPDNGLIPYAVDRVAMLRMYAVENTLYFSRTVSATFHGRDIFAPVAARLASGLDPSALGPSVSECVGSGLPPVRVRSIDGEQIEERGEVILVDRFGNAITNLSPRPRARFARLDAGAHTFDRLCRTYGEVSTGDPLVLTSSFGFLEVAVRERSAARQLELHRGDPVAVLWRNEDAEA